MKNSQTHLDTLRWVDLKLSKKVTIWGSAISRNIASFIPPKASSSPLKNDCWKIILSFWNSPFLGDPVRVVLFWGVTWVDILSFGVESSAEVGLSTKIWHPTIRKFWSEVYSHLFFLVKGFTLCLPWSSFLLYQISLSSAKKDLFLKADFLKQSLFKLPLSPCCLLLRLFLSNGKTRRDVFAGRLGMCMPQKPLTSMYWRNEWSTIENVEQNISSEEKDHVANVHSCFGAC